MKRIFLSFLTVLVTHVVSEQSVPTRALSNSIQPSSECTNKIDFSKDGQHTCKQIRNNNKRRQRLCLDDDVRHNCPQACGICCKDDETYTFKHGWNKTQKNCLWIAKRPIRIQRLCGKDKSLNGREIRDACPKSCNVCKDLVEPSDDPSASPSSMPSSVPSTRPSLVPSGNPSTHPSSGPSTLPSCKNPSSKGKGSNKSHKSQTSSKGIKESVRPSSIISDNPSTIPSSNPRSPTVFPSIKPSDSLSQNAGDKTSAPSKKKSSKGKRSNKSPESPKSQKSSKCSSVPSTRPSLVPSGHPSTHPSSGPSTLPSMLPSLVPSVIPSSKPSDDPSASPSSISNPEEECSRCSTQTDYRGILARTSSGKTCQRWDSQIPHIHNITQANYPSAGLVENYCRNPDGDAKAWCYTTISNCRWEYCNVPTCSSLVPSGNPSTRPSSGPSGPSFLPTSRPSISPSVSPSFLPTTQYEYRVETDRDTWFNHGYRAYLWGGDLVSIHSSADSIIISNLMKAHLAPRHSIWLGGLRNEFNTTQWKWKDCSNFDYANWDAGQPGLAPYIVRKADQTWYTGESWHEHYAIYYRVNV